MCRDRSKYNEKRSVCGDLQTEFDRLLQSHKDYSQDRADPEPSSHPALRRMMKPLSRLSAEECQRHQSRNTDQESSLGPELQVVVVRSLVGLVDSGHWIGRHYPLIRVQA